MKRTVTPELLDSDRGTPQQIADSLGDLRMINRYFGGHSTTTSLLHRVAAVRGLQQLSVLDVAGASGDAMQAAQQALAKHGIALGATVLDAKTSHLGARNGFARVTGDALRLPFTSNSYDVVSCSLFLHHLEPPQVAEFLKGALLVARHAVVINDLRRSVLHLLAVYSGFLLYQSAITRHDSVASVHRAYTKAELSEMIRNAHSGKFDISDSFLFRMRAIVWR